MKYKVLVAVSVVSCAVAMTIYTAYGQDWYYDDVCYDVECDKFMRYSVSDGEHYEVEICYDVCYEDVCHDYVHTPDWMGEPNRCYDEDGQEIIISSKTRPMQRPEPPYIDQHGNDITSFITCFEDAQHVYHVTREAIWTYYSYNEPDNDYIYRDGTTLYSPTHMVRNAASEVARLGITYDVTHCIDEFRESMDMDGLKEHMGIEE